MIAGVDEAGRGPIIGAMVMATVVVESESDLPKELKDSKVLSREQREALFPKLIEFTHALKVIEPAEIDEWVNEKKLNYLEAKYTVQMLKELKPSKAVIDCPSRNLDAYKDVLQKDLPDVELVVQHKADAEHAVVAAASVIAKVTRDRLVDQIKAELNIDIGSGYLTDPKTQAFMKDADLTLPFWRRSWRPYKDLVANKEQNTLF